MQNTADLVQLLFFLFLGSDQQQQRRLHSDRYPEVGKDGLQAGRGVAAAVRAQGADAGLQENETAAQITGVLHWWWWALIGNYMHLSHSCRESFLGLGRGGLTSE